MKYEPHDSYFHRAKAEGYLARSVYKLEAIDAKYHLVAPGMHVVDLGAAPGSWSQYLLAKVGPQGRVLAVDIQEVRLRADNLEFQQMDVLAAEIENFLAGKIWHGLVSDMAPATTGNRCTDQARSAALVERSLYLAQRFLQRGGFWVAKLLEGPERAPLTRAAQQIFERVHIFRPPATRKGSTECFLIGLRKRL
ncbi:MAG: RlmE family RNA methyltransferase [Bacteroidia bacterium]|nr:RlmE family RNA methyltransferase [Bacteroidia bacterium]MCX7652196.1 RlmE family RNA methyltransferase [Bacteroidia bacterium]MDW8416458.1 RlmE family RNA methyltransferase [Bacteroidia bacterium]